MDPKTGAPQAPEMSGASAYNKRRDSIGDDMRERLCDSTAIVKNFSGQILIASISQLYCYSILNTAHLLCLPVN